MLKVEIYFGGFYYSEHSENINNAILYTLFDGNSDAMEKAYEEDKISLTEYEYKYSKQIVDNLNTTFGLHLEFDRVYTPKSYNFESDSITVKMSIKDCLTLLKLVKEEGLKECLKQKIKEKTTSYDGYWAYYKYKDYFKSENRDILMELIFQMLDGLKGFRYSLDDFSI